MTKRNLPYLMVVAALSAVLAFAAIGCGGDDEETPAGTCQTSSDCEDGQACYNNVCVGVCTSDADCAAPLTCDPVFKVCLPGDITDGDIDTDAPCTVGQNQCIGSTVYTCVSGAWTAGQNCADTGMTCQNGVCIPGTTDGDTDEVVDGDTTDEVVDGDTTDDIDNPASCTEGEKKCIGDMAYTCTGGNWTFLEDCADQGKTCSAGVCEGGSTTTELCPSGQTCTDINSGLMACLTADGQVPSGNQTGCGQDSPCAGNASCFCADENCSQTVCIGNCGTCPAGQVCTDINSGLMACLTSDGQVPSSNQTGCGQNSPCTGNAACYCADENCSQTVCINNCSAGGSGPVDPPTGEGCPTGQVCTDINSGLMACLTADGQVPSSNQTGCGQDSPCAGNASCFCADENCSQTVCINNCGTCPTGQVCTDVNSGLMACLTADGQVPSGNQTGCGQDSPCAGNAACYCADENCSQTVCINNCGG